MKVIIKTLKKMPKHTRGKPGAGMFLIPDEHVQPKITAMYSQPAFRLEGSCNTIKRESDNLQDAAFSGLILGTP